jgi:phosphoribosylanthranilate isomerase
VQLHGDESEAFIWSLKQKMAYPVIKAVRVQNTEKILQTQELSCDLLLLDTYQPSQYGGSGQTFDRTLIPELQKQFFLAGGLDIGNVEQAIRECHPFGIDISSGVETDGVKDETKIREIIAIIRNMIQI